MALQQLYDAGYLILIGLLWGGTNPFLKKYSKGITQVECNNSRLRRFLLEMKYLLTNRPYLLTVGLNQLGSVLYFLTLQRSRLSVLVPVANSLTLIFTAICGLILGEKQPNKGLLLGVAFILVGTTLCYVD